MKAFQALLRLFGMRGSDIRPWGSWIRYADPVCLKSLQVGAGQALSLQRHHHRSEFWAVLAGHPTVTIDGREETMSPGDTCFIPVGVEHRLVAGAEPVQVLELAFGHYAEADIERIEDRYGRVTNEQP